MNTHTNTQPPIIEDAAEHADDIEVIRGVIADVETGFNTKDVDLAAGHFAANAITTTATGVRLSGQEALVQAHRDAFAGPLREQYARYEVDDVIFLRPDVALAQKRAWATDADGAHQSSDPAMVALYVMVKEGERWWISARANTLVQHG